jgi:sarcosine oxidase subunit alpha
MRVSQNRWPSLGFDIGAVNDIASPMFSAGFYYKTFMWPKAAWATALRTASARRPASALRRRQAGSGPLPPATRIARCLSAGGGPAGIAAALAAAETGVRVILADEQAAFGGSLRADAGTLIDGRPGHEWAQADHRAPVRHAQRSRCCRARPCSAI